MRMPNYIPDENPFRLAGPPQWWLDRLHDYDDSLVIVPSRTGFYYRLAQRRQPDLRTNIVNDILKEDSDTRMLYRHGLVPITTVLATANWSNPAMFTELSRRAPWRNGGADEYEKKILTQERQEKLQKAIKQNEDLEYLSKDAWRYYQKKVGTRSNVYIPKTGDSNKPEVRTGLRRVSKKQAYRPDLVTNWGNPRLFK